MYQLLVVNFWTNNWLLANIAVTPNLIVTNALIFIQKCFCWFPSHVFLRNILWIELPCVTQTEHQNYWIISLDKGQITTCRYKWMPHQLTESTLSWTPSLVCQAALQTKCVIFLHLTYTGTNYLPPKAGNAFSNREHQRVRDLLCSLNPSEKMANLPLSVFFFFSFPSCPSGVHHFGWDFCSMVTQLTITLWHLWYIQ